MTSIYQFIFVVSFLLLSVGGRAQDLMDSAPAEQTTSKLYQADSTLTKKIDETSQAILDTLNADVKKAPSDIPEISSVISFSKIFWSIVLIGIGYVFINLLSKTLELLAEKSTKYRITIKSFVPVVKILGWILLVFVIVAGVFHPPASTVLAFSASVGVAIGFASQDILKNIFGGVMILFDRPFRTGDKIEVGSFYGEVVDIGLRSTRIVTPDDNLVSVPNGDVMSSPVSNANAGEANCQVVAEVYLPITVDTRKVRTIATQAAQVSRFVFLNKPITIVFSNEYKERKSLYKMKIKAYVLDIRDEFKFKSDMVELTIEALIREGILDDD